MKNFPIIKVNYDIIIIQLILYYLDIIIYKDDETQSFVRNNNILNNINNIDNRDSNILSNTMNLKPNIDLLNNQKSLLNNTKTTTQVNKTRLAQTFTNPRDNYKRRISLKEYQENEKELEELQQLGSKDNSLKVKKKANEFSIQNISRLIFQENTIIVISSISVYLLHILNLILLNHTDADLIFTTIYQIGFIYLNVCGFNFLRGSLDTFRGTASYALIKNDREKVVEFYHEARTYCFLFVLIVIFPLSFVSNYSLRLLPSLDLETIETTAKFIKVYMLANVLELYFDINSILLNFQNYKFYVLGTNLTCFIIHLICSILSLFYYRFGVIGIAVSGCISSGMKFIITQILCYLFNPCPEKNILMIETDVLNSTNFFYYFKNAFILGFVSAIKYIYFEVFGFMCLFIDNESFIASVLMLNIISFLFHVIFSVTVNFENILSNYILKSITNIDEAEFELFLVDNPHYIKKFKKDKCRPFAILKMLLSKTKYESTVAELEFKYQETNDKRVKLMINGLLYFCFLMCLSTSLVVFIFRGYICRLFVADEWIENKLEELLMYYCVFVFFDWMNQVYTSLISNFGSILVLTITKGLFGLFVFLPLGVMLTNTFKIGINGLWYGLYAYCLMFFFVSYFIFSKIDLKSECEIIRKKFSIKKRIVDEIENFYKLN